MKLLNKIFGLKEENTKNNLETQKLTKYQMKCPYCRTLKWYFYLIYPSCKKNTLLIGLKNIL